MLNLHKGNFLRADSSADDESANSNSNSNSFAATSFSESHGKEAAKSYFCKEMRGQKFSTKLDWQIWQDVVLNKNNRNIAVPKGLNRSATASDFERENTPIEGNNT